MVAAAVVAADQVTKSLAVEDLATHSVHVIGPLNLVLTYNSGVAFSLLTGLTLPIVVVVVSVVGLLAWLARGVPTLPGCVAIGAVLGGALGNLSDRLFRGHGGSVVDFIATGFWPTFNLADASIVIGCVALFLVLWRHPGGDGRPGETERSGS